MPFEIEGYDSDSIKYFSKFGRNYSLSKKPSAIKSNQKKKSHAPDQYARKVKTTLSTFEMS